MNQLWKTFSIVIVSLVFFLNTATAQEILPQFPQANQTVTFLDLVDGALGFQWDDTGSATDYTVIIDVSEENPQIGIVELDAQTSPLFLPGTFRSVFTEGNFSWTVQTSDGARTSASIPFTINSSGLEATPTPAGFQPEPPSGDLNASSQIDKNDIYLLALNWKQNLFDPYAADFNLDGDVDQEDLLVMASRFGTAAVPPTPSPPVGLPGNLTFYPNDVVGFGELPNFKIQWDTPQYPEDVVFYELLILSEFGQEIVSRRFLQENEISLSFLTQSADYQVFIRAKNSEGVTGNFISGVFTVDQNRIVTPTPNSGIVDIDFNRDGTIDAQDSRLFIQAFGTFNIDENFISDADFNQDGFIDSSDLATFQANYPNPPAATASPTWDSIVRTIYTLGSFSNCESSGTNETIPLSTLDITFPSSTCMLSELYNAQFTFTPVDNALDYYYSIYFEGDSEPALQGFTNGETFFTEFSILLQNISFILEVRAVNDGLQFSEASEPLRLTVPSISNG